MSLTLDLNKQIEKETNKLISAIDRNHTSDIKKARAKLLGFLPKIDKSQDLLAWGTLQANIGMASLILSTADQDIEKLRAALDICEEAIDALRTEDQEKADYLQETTQHIRATLCLIPLRSDKENEEYEYSYEAPFSNPLEERVLNEINMHTMALADLPNGSPTTVVTKMALVAALSELASLNEDTEPADRAILLLREMVEDYAANEDYSDSMPMINLALAQLLVIRDQFEEDDEVLAEAIALYRKNHEKISRKSTPAEWADTQLLYGEALMNLGARSHRADMVEEGIAIQNATLSYWKKNNPDKLPEIQECQDYYKNPAGKYLL